MVILNNQLIIKQGTQGNIRYSYEDLKQMGVTEFNKQQVDYLSGTVNDEYFIFRTKFVSLFIYSFVCNLYFINTLINKC